LAKIEVAFPRWEEYQGEFLGSGFGRKAAVAAWTSAAKFVSRPSDFSGIRVSEFHASEFQSKDPMLTVDRRSKRCSGREGAEG
jgi:hypothetical protein